MNMLKKFHVKLLFTDTDSLVYEIKEEDVYEKSFQDKELFDFSEYPVNSRFYGLTNKKVHGKMKHEFKGQKISEFVGLKSKIYSLITAEDKNVNKAKGVNKNIRYKEFAGAFFNKKVIRHNMSRVQSKLHEISTYDIYKISLSCFADKRYVLEDDVNIWLIFKKA